MLDFLGLELWKSHEFGEMDLRVTKQKDIWYGLEADIIYKVFLICHCLEAKYGKTGFSML